MMNSNQKKDVPLGIVTQHIRDMRFELARRCFLRSDGKSSTQQVSSNKSMLRSTFWMRRALKHDKVRAIFFSSPVPHQDHISRRHPPGKQHARVRERKRARERKNKQEERIRAFVSDKSKGFAERRMVQAKG